MKHKFNRAYFILALFIIVALAVTFCRSLSYNYEMQGEVINLSGFYSGATGYEASKNADGTMTFKAASDDPQLIYKLSGNTQPFSIGGIELKFGSEWTDENSLPIQIFYAKTGEDYSEKHSAKGELKTGEDTLLIPISLGEYETLRIDIDGDFTLLSISGCTNQMESHAFVSRETIQSCMWYFPAVIIGFCLIFWAHGERIRQGKFTAKAYLENVFLGAKPDKDREVYLDYMRVLAAVLVILAHACSPMVSEAAASWKRLVLVCGLSLGLCCNLIYVMLSGTLLLSAKAQKEESVIAFYIKRASKVIIPLIAYYMLLLSLNGEVGFLPPQNIVSALKRIVTGAPDVAPHLWLIYTILALYLVTPFFRVMVQHMSDRLMFSLAAVILVLNILTTYLPLFGMTFGASTFLAGWEGVFLIGYIMTRQNKLPNADRRNNYMIIAAAVSYVITVAVVFADSSLMNYVYNSAPTLVAASCGIFAVFLKNKEKFKGKSNPVIRLCSKYSYSIILIHWYALFVVVSGKMHITALRFGCLGGIAATVVTTFIVCIVMAIAFDNTVVIVLNVIFEKITKGITKAQE